jgi:hypothetical protein
MPLVKRSATQPKTFSTTQNTSKTTQGKSAATSVPKTGWNANTKASALKMTSQTLDKGPNVGGKLVAPKGFSIDVVEFKKEIKGTRPDGFKFTGSFAGQQILLTGADGKRKVVADTTREAAKSAQAYDANKSSAGVMSKSEASTYTGVGSAGALMSLTRINPADTFMKPSVNRIQTVDARTGKAVKLSELLSKSQFQSIVAQVGSNLATIDNSGAYEGGANAAALDQNFALTTDSKGKVQIHLAWESGVHGLAGTMAHFTFEAPTDAAFRAKLGL